MPRPVEKNKHIVGLLTNAVLKKKFSINVTLLIFLWFGDFDKARILYNLFQSVIVPPIMPFEYLIIGEYHCEK